MELHTENTKYIPQPKYKRPHTITMEKQNAIKLKVNKMRRNENETKERNRK